MLTNSKTIGLHKQTKIALAFKELNKHDVTMEVKIVKVIKNTMLLSEIRKLVEDLVCDLVFNDHLNAEINKEKEKDIEVLSIIKKEDRIKAREGVRIDRLMKICQYFPREISSGKVIGKGGFGEVIKSKWNFGTLNVAVKRAFDYNEASVFQEAQTTLKFRSINSVAFLGFQIESNEKHQQQYNMVLEFIEGKTLESYINSKENDIKNPLGKLRAINYSIQLARGIQFLSKNHIVHRDLKPENILIDKYNCLKIIDFGISKRFQATHDATRTREIGTAKYFPPEYLVSDANEEGATTLRKISLAFDVWCFGLIICNLFSKQATWSKLNENQIMAKLCQEEGSYPIPSGIKDNFLRFIIEKCLEWKPEKRIKIDKALDLLKISYLKTFIETFKDKELCAKSIPKNDLTLVMTTFDYLKQDIKNIDMKVCAYGNALWEANYVAEAKHLIDKVLSKHPKNEVALQTKANIHEKLSNYQSAIKSYSLLVSLITISDKKAEINFKIGECSHKLGDYNTAIVIFTNLIKTETKNQMKYHLALGKIYYDVSLFKKAEFHLLEVDKKAKIGNIKENLEANKLLAKIYSMKNQDHMVHDRYEKITKKLSIKNKDKDLTNYIERMKAENKISKENKNEISFKMSSSSGVITAFNTYCHHLNEQVLVVSHTDGKIKLYSYNTKEVVMVINCNREVHAMTEISCKGFKVESSLITNMNLLATYNSMSKKVCFWNYVFYNELIELSYKTEEIDDLVSLKTIRLSDKTEHIVEIYKTNFIIRLNKTAFKPMDFLTKNSSEVITDTMLIHMKNKDFLAVASSHGRIVVFDIASKTMEFALLDNMRENLVEHKFINMSNGNFIAYRRLNEESELLYFEDNMQQQTRICEDLKVMNAFEFTCDDKNRLLLRIERNIFLWDIDKNAATYFWRLNDSEQFLGIVSLDTCLFALINNNSPQKKSVTGVNLGKFIYNQPSTVLTEKLLNIRYSLKGKNFGQFLYTSEVGLEPQITTDEYNELFEGDSNKDIKTKLGVFYTLCFDTLEDKKQTNVSSKMRYLPYLSYVTNYNIISRKKSVASDEEEMMIIFKLNEFGHLLYKSEENFTKLLSNIWLNPQNLFKHIVFTFKMFKEFSRELYEYYNHCGMLEYFPQELNLGENQIKNQIDSLSHCRLLEKVHSLNLSYNELKDEGIKKMSRCTNFSNLEELNLGINALNDKSIEHLKECSFLSNLSGLNLMINDLTAMAILNLSECSFLSKLKKLNLNSNNVQPLGMFHLAKCTFLANLTHLDLKDNSIRSEGIKNLKECVFLSNLLFLELNGNAIGNEGLEHLRDCLFLSNLTSLTLYKNLITELGIQSLRSCTFLDKLERLDLSFNNINQRGMESFSQCKYLESLKELNLCSTNLGDGGMYYLKNCDFMSNLTDLNLSDNKISNKGMESFVGCRFLLNLIRLNLSKNNIGSDGFENLKECDFLWNLTKLELGANEIGDEGLVFLQDCTFFSNLLYLDLERNNIREVGFECIRNCSFLTNLKELSLRGNYLTEESLMMLTKDKPELLLIHN